MQTCDDVEVMIPRYRDIAVPICDEVEMMIRSCENLSVQTCDKVEVMISRYKDLATQTSGVMMFGSCEEDVCERALLRE